MVASERMVPFSRLLPEGLVWCDSNWNELHKTQATSAHGRSALELQHRTARYRHVAGNARRPALVEVPGRVLLFVGTLR